MCLKLKTLQKHWGQWTYWAYRKLRAGLHFPKSRGDKKGFRVFRCSLSGSSVSPVCTFRLYRCSCMRDFEELDSKASYEREILNSWMRCVSRTFPHEDLTPFVNARIPNTSLLTGYLILPFCYLIFFYFRKQGSFNTSSKFGQQALIVLKTKTNHTKKHFNNLIGT